MLIYFLMCLTTAFTATVSLEDCNRLDATTPCCYNHVFDEITGQCTECRIGNIGWDCNQTCPSGFYGRLCTTACECDSSLCNPATGCTRHTITGTTSTDGLNGTLHTTTGSTSTKGLIDQTKVISDVNTDWHFLLVLLIGALVSTLIGGALLNFRHLIDRYHSRLITSHAHRNQDRGSTVPQNVVPDTTLSSMVTVIPSSINEPSSNLEDTHLSRPNTNCVYDLCSSSGGSSTSHNISCLQSVMDDKRSDNEDDYSHLLLRNKHSSKYNFILNEGIYSYLQPKEAAKRNHDFTMKRSKSLPVVSRYKRGQSSENKRFLSRSSFLDNKQS